VLFRSLRSRAASWRSGGHRRASERLLARSHPQLTPLFRASDRRYNAAAATLELLAARPAGSAPVVRQVAVAKEARLVGRFSTDAARIEESVRLGAAAMAAQLDGCRDVRIVPIPPNRKVHHG